MTEQEEFEFRARAEKERAPGVKASEPSYSPVEGNSTWQNIVEGVGRGVTAGYRALQQAGGYVSPQQRFYNQATDLDGRIEEAKKLDKPLMDTAGGKVGNLIGNVALAAPTMMIPGANTVTGASLIGAAFGGATQDGSLAERAKAATFGAAGGAAGVGLGKGIGALAERAAVTKAKNAGRVAAADAARDAGYVLPPTEVNPNLLNSALEGLSGKIKTSQAASTKNQATTNLLAKKAVGAQPDVPLSVEGLEAIRKQAGQAYQAIASTGQVTPTAAYDTALDAIAAPFVQASKGFPNAKPNPIIEQIESLRTPTFDAGAGLGKIAELRSAADVAWKQGDKQGTKALKAAADAIEQQLDAHLTKIGAPTDMIQNFRDARQLIAKTYTLQKAVNRENGDVSANLLAAELKKDKPLTGELRTIAEAASAFPKATQALPQSYNAVSPLDYLAGVGTAAATQNPLNLLAVAARPAVRSLILSKPYQSLIGPPSNRMLNLLADNPALPVAGMVAATEGR